MKAQPSQILAAFVDAYGPGLDPDRAAAAVDALLAEQARLARVTYPDNIRQRRAHNALIRAMQEYRVTEDELRTRATDPHVRAAKLAFASYLDSAGLSERQVAAETGMGVRWAHEAPGRHMARAGRVAAVAAAAPAGRRAAHG